MKKILLLSILFLSFSLNAQKLEKTKTISTTPKTSISLENIKTNPLFIVNKKKVTKSYFKKLDPETIKSINIYKENEAIERFGKSGKNGVVVVILKSKKELST